MMHLMWELEMERLLKKNLSMSFQVDSKKTKRKKWKWKVRKKWKAWKSKTMAAKRFFKTKIENLTIISYNDKILEIKYLE